MFRLNIVWISGMLTGLCLVFGILHNIEYELICYDLLEGPHENVFGICSENQKAFITHKAESGYRYFTIISMFLLIVVTPMCLILFFLCHLVYK